MKKLFLIFLMSIGLAFGSGDKEENMEYLSSLFSAVADKEVKMNNKQDIALFYDAFIKPIESNAQMREKFSKFYDEFGTLAVKFVVFGLEVEYLNQVKNIFMDYSSETQSSMIEAKTAINTAIKDAGNNLKKESEILQGLATDPNYLESFVFVMTSFAKIYNDNLSYFLSNCSSDAKALADDKKTIQDVVLFYFMKDAMQKVPEEIKIADRELIAKQLNEILKSKGIEADAMIKSHYDSHIKLTEDFIKKANILKELQ